MTSTTENSESTENTESTESTRSTEATDSTKSGESTKSFKSTPGRVDDTHTAVQDDRIDGRKESPNERADRQWSELIQEVRVAQTGVQIMFGFLLTVVFTPRFTTLSGADKNIYLLTVVLGAVAMGALIGPVAFHRVVSGRRMKARAVTWASRLTVTGLFLLLATLVSALLLILRVATHNHVVPWIVGGVVVWYLLCWLVLPLWASLRHGSEREED